MFGLWAGTLIVSFASSVGATLAFLAARWLLGDWVRARIKAFVGISTQVTVGAPDSIERTLVGKARRVVDLRKK